jgi:hypothetical protein
MAVGRLITGIVGDELTCADRADSGHRADSGTQADSGTEPPSVPATDKWWPCTWIGCLIMLKLLIVARSSPAISPQLQENRFKDTYTS